MHQCGWQMVWMVSNRITLRTGWACSHIHYTLHSLLHIAMGCSNAQGQCVQKRIHACYCCCNIVFVTPCRVCHYLFGVVLVMKGRKTEIDSGRFLHSITFVNIRDICQTTKTCPISVMWLLHLRGYDLIQHTTFVYGLWEVTMSVCRKWLSFVNKCIQEGKG